MLCCFKIKRTSNLDVIVIVNSHLYCASYNTCKYRWHITANGDDSSDDNDNDNEDDNDNNKNIDKVIVIIVAVSFMSMSLYDQTFPFSFAANYSRDSLRYSDLAETNIETGRNNVELRCLHLLTNNLCKLWTCHLPQVTYRACLKII